MESPKKVWEKLLPPSGGAGRDGRQPPCPLPPGGERPALIRALTRAGRDAVPTPSGARPRVATQVCTEKLRAGFASFLGGNSWGRKKKYPILFKIIWRNRNPGRATGKGRETQRCFEWVVSSSARVAEFSLHGSGDEKDPERATHKKTHPTEFFCLFLKNIIDCQTTIRDLGGNLLHKRDVKTALKFGSRLSQIFEISNPDETLFKDRSKTTASGVNGCGLQQKPFKQSSWKTCSSKAWNRNSRKAEKRHPPPLNRAALTIPEARQRRERKIT